MDQLPTNLVALVAVVAVLWWRIRELEKRFERWSEERDIQWKKTDDTVGILKNEVQFLVGAYGGRRP